MNLIEQLVTHILDTQFESFPAEDIARAKDRIIDVLGCAFVGARSPAYAMVAEMVGEMGGRQEATVLVHGGKVPAQNAAFANCIMATASDFDPAFPIIDGKRYLIHMSGTSVPTALAAAECAGKGGKDVIAALILGDDLTSRIAAASMQTPSYGWDSGSTMSFFGTTAIVGKLWGLNANQMRNAFGIMLHQIAGTKQSHRDRTHCFKLGQGLPARGGILSVELAKRGMVGARDPLLSEFGYFNLYCKTHNVDFLTRSLGKKFYSDTTFKRYPCCSALTSAIDCAIDLVRRHDFESGDIDILKLEVPPQKRDDLVLKTYPPGDVPAVSAGFSMPYVIASVLVRKGISPEHFHDEFVLDPEVLGLMKRTQIGLLPADKLVAAVDGWRTDLIVRVRDGREFRSSVDMPSIDPVHRPLLKSEIRDKYRANAAFSKKISVENANAALDMLENLEEVKDISRLIALVS